MLALADKWVWDFWLADDDDKRHHIFYLQAPRSLGDPELRHHHASIGHAVSDDLFSWSPLADAIGPGGAGEWDDLATWTGSVIRDGDVWRMLYTGICRADDGLVQRIGLASSDDLVHWEKHPANPVLEADPRWYEQLDSGRWRDQSWRDPHLYRVEGEPGFRVLLTARARSGASDGAGVVGQARSDDLVHWEVLPPLTAPGEFAQVEVPQRVEIDGRSVILFSCWAEDHSAARRERLADAAKSGTFAFVDNGDGTYLPTTTPLAAAEDFVLYAGKVVTGHDGTQGFMAFRGPGSKGFGGDLTDPMPIGFSAEGELTARWA